MEIWEICEEITCKSDWYHKIFDSEIVNTWKKEVNNHDNFDLAISLLRSSALGTNLVENCGWDDNYCQQCMDEYKQYITENPDELSEDWGSNNAEKLTNFFGGDWKIYYDYHNNDCIHIRCKCISPKSSLEDYVNYNGDGILDKNYHDECKILISEMMKNETIDWHPGSDNKVRDLIHPSLYCYVKGISHGSKGEYNDLETDYQWLPSEFIIDKDNNVKIHSYVNNLDHQKYPKFIPLLEKIFKQYIPGLEKVIHKSLNDKTLQVIVKVGSIILTKENDKYDGGSWHIEGAAQEHIAATAIHYVDVENITDSFLEFRKPTIINEENLDYPQDDGNYTSHHYGLEKHYDGHMNKYLGLIKCSEGADVIFPNSLQHRVKEFKLQPGCETSTRTILAFFVIDPEHRIISTKNILPQQLIISREKANHYRQRLMYYRKYFVDSLNEEVIEREYSLCEH